MQNTYLYIRFSDDKQAQGSSYERQLSYARQYCPTLIEDKDHIYFDSGKSAFSGANLQDGSELKRFYDAVASGRVPKGSILLVEDLDRLSRAGMWKASDKLRELTENGITVVTLRDSKRYTGTLTLSDALTSLIKQELAHEESAKKSSRVAKSYVDRYAKARQGIKVKVLLPSWIEWVSDTEYRVKEAEAAVVRRIFDMAGAGVSYQRIVKTLNEDGIAPFRGGGKNKLWITATVFQMVQSPAAIGTYTPNDGGTPIENYFPAIVSKEVFDAAQGARIERREDKVTRESRAVSLWSKVGVCMRCSRPMHYLPKGRKNQRYLVCSGKMGYACDAQNVHDDRATRAFEELLVNVVNADYFTGNDGKETLQRIRQLSGQIADQQRIKDRQVEMLGIDPIPELGPAIKKSSAIIETLEAEKATLEAAVAQATKAETSKAAILQKLDLVSEDGRREANMLLRRLKVVVKIGRYDDVINYEVRQAGRKVLTLHDSGGEISSTAFSQDVAERMHEQGETDALEYSVDLEQFFT